MIRRSGRVALLLAVAVGTSTALAAGCGPTPPSASPHESLTGSLVPAASAVGSPSAPAPTGSPISVGSPGATVQVDPGLLAFVPDTVEGIPLTFDPDTSATIAADPSVAPEAAGLAVALAIGPGASGAGDLAIVSVIRLRNPARDGAWFRDWRDTYDAAACGQAGGVTGNAEAELGGGTVFIGSCAGGALTYHTRLFEAGIVVSVTALGDRRLGEKVITGVHR